MKGSTAENVGLKLNMVGWMNLDPVFQCFQNQGDGVHAHALAFFASTGCSFIAVPFTLTASLFSVEHCQF